MTDREDAAERNDGERLAPPLAASMSIGPFRLDTLRHSLATEDGAVQLSPIASRLLQTLAECPGAVVTRRALIDRLWSGNELVGDAAINRVVSELRRAVNDDARAPTFIQTVPRQGYRLVATANAELSPATAGRRTGPGFWTKAAIAMLGVFLGGVALHLIIEGAIGLAWTLRHS